MKVLKDQIEIAETIVKNNPGVFIGGSWLVNQEEANDIDIIWATGKHVPAGWFRHQLEKEAFIHDYAMLAEELIAVYRMGQINLIEIRPEYKVAYEAACVHMDQHPWDFQTRDKRVELHQACKNAIRMLFGTAQLTEFPHYAAPDIMYATAVPDGMRQPLF